MNKKQLQTSIKKKLRVKEPIQDLFQIWIGMKKIEKAIEKRKDKIW